VRRSDLIETPHGRCAVITLSDEELDGALAALPEAERDAADRLSGVRRRELIAGRTAIHALLGGAHPVLANERGAPVVPAGLTGSISHKRAHAAAIVAAADHGHVGIDLEGTAPTKLDISRRILTANEPRVHGAELLRVFAIKEAIYKAIDPIVRRYVGFQEVELVIGEGGEVRVTVVDEVRLPVSIEAWWTIVDDHWLATARANPR
jgi:4'-phosphopantetheinyl transferase EntD